uniref:Glucagon receptor b n=1 Tax=Lates calcarifer TaxID=8187 RepID=A0A4W6DXJ5_LATCA
MSQVCLLLALLMLCSCTKVSSTNSLELVKEQWSSYKNQCLDYLNATPPATGEPPPPPSMSSCLYDVSMQESEVSLTYCEPTAQISQICSPAAGLVCNRTFDLYACWPDGLPGTTVNVSCPWFLPWYRKVQQGLVYRVCKEDGQWAQKNTSECEDDPGEQQYGRILSQLRIMYTVGYSLSLGALLLALGILITFRKLHCMRNNIHMNLFASFILRAVSILVKDALLTLTLDAQSSSDTQTQAWVDIPAVSWCRAAMVMMQYSVMANNYWLLVEGIYLHSLLVITVFSERKYFYIYLAIGWGAPLIFVLPWITVKYLYENEECWERNINMGYWWIIRSPILFAYLINFFIFIRIIKILMSKLRAHQMRYTDYKFRLAKSTLTLIPLLGIHAILFTFVIDESVPKGSMLRLIRLFCDLLFNSFQVRTPSYLTLVCFCVSSLSLFPLRQTI